jgi:hypothetical protein
MNQTGFQDMMGNETIVDAARMNNANCVVHHHALLLFGQFLFRQIGLER